MTVLGEQAEEHVFTIENGLTAKCKKATFLGTMLAARVPTLEVTPAYSECSAFGFPSATITVNSCKYKLLEPSGAGPFTGNVSVVCAGEEVMKIATSTCEVTIGNQESKSKVTHRNQATTPSTILAEPELSGLKYTKTKDNFLCPLSGTGVKKTANTPATPRHWGKRHRIRYR